MKKIISIGLIFVSATAVSQEWHKVTDTIKYPSHMAETSMGWRNHYDTVPIVVLQNASNCDPKGYKRVYVFKGYYIDDSSTLNIYFDSKMNRRNDVFYYHF